MKHWFVFFLALASVGSVKGQQTITLSNYTNDSNCNGKEYGIYTKCVWPHKCQKSCIISI